MKFFHLPAIFMLFLLVSLRPAMASYDHKKFQNAMYECVMMNGAASNYDRDTIYSCLARKNFDLWDMPIDRSNTQNYQNYQGSQGYQGAQGYQASRQRSRRGRTITPYNMYGGGTEEEGKDSTGGTGGRYYLPADKSSGGPKPVYIPR